VAPSDMHLSVKAGGVLGVVRGPKENGHRPSIDMLFRTASAVHGARVIGIVLSGELDCGTAGVLSIRSRGGIAIAQDPAEAEAPSMPSSAAKVGKADYVASLADIPNLLLRLLQEPLDVSARSEALPSALLSDSSNVKGTAPPLVCPTCQGVLQESETGSYESFRCHVGHVFSLQSVVLEQAESMERALWSAVRSLEESASLSGRLAQRRGGNMRQRFEEKQRDQLRQADVIRNLILHGTQLAQADSAQPWTAPELEEALAAREHGASEKRPD